MKSKKIQNENIRAIMQALHGCRKNCSECKEEEKELEKEENELKEKMK